MSEDHKYKGKLWDKEQEAHDLRIALKGLVDALRDKLDPTEPVEDLEAELIQNLAMQFAQRQAELKGVLQDIRDVKKILGRA